MISSNRCQNIFQSIVACQLNISGLSQHSSIALDQYRHTRDINIMALQETRIDSIQTDIFSGMQTFLNPTGHGVSLSITNSLKPQLVEQLLSPNTSSIWATVEVDGKTVFICSAYCRPEPNSTKSLENLLENIDCALKYGKHYGIDSFLIFGDFNARSFSWGDSSENPRGKILLKFVHDHPNIAISAPNNKTFVTRGGGGSLIDLVLSCGRVSKCLGTPWTDSRDVHTLFTGAPDRGHLPVLYNITLNCKNPARKARKVFDFKNGDWDNWKLELDSFFAEKLVDLNNDNSCCPQDMTELFHATLMTACNNHIPSKISCIHSKPFWNENLTSLSLNLRDAQNNYSKKSSPHYKKLLDSCKDSFKTELVKSKNNWIHNQLEGLNVMECQIFWKRYKRYFCKRDECIIGNLMCPITDSLKENDQEREVLLFDTFFCGKHLDNSKFDDTHHNKVTDEVDIIIGNNFDIETLDPSTDDDSEEITIEEVSWAISKQKTCGKTSDATAVHPTMLKHLPRNAKLYLTALYNNVMESGDWIWNDALVTFIKKPNKTSYMDPGSYRPLSLFPYIGKILERVLENRIRKFCSLGEIIDDAQEGFLPCKNTTRYLYKMVSNLTEIKRRKFTALILLIDFEKAFDSVSLPCLIWKLYNFGIKGKILRIIHSFLSQRNVRLRINSYIGPNRLCALIGVPQGSVLSPILFIIFISDLLKPGNLPNSVQSCTEVFKFADDGSVIVIANDVQNAIEKMQIVADYIANWCTKWRLCINCSKDKTEVIIIDPNICAEESVHLQKIAIGGNLLLYVPKSRVLGVIIDEKLSFVQHSRSTLKNVSYHWQRLADDTTRKRGLNTSSLSLLFKTVILTKILYASPVWLNDNLDIFKRFMSKSLLRITGAQFYPSNELSRLITGIPSLNHLHIRVVIKFILKCLSQADGISGCILQIEETPGHPFHKHVTNAKDFLKNKHENLQNKRNSQISLVSFEKKQLHYHKNDVLKYICKMWDEELCGNMKTICKKGPYILENDTVFEMLETYINSYIKQSKLLFLQEIAHRLRTQGWQIFCMDIVYVFRILLFQF